MDRETENILRERGADDPRIMQNLGAPKIVVMTAAEKATFDPMVWVARLIDAGFVLDSIVCPVKIRRPWGTVELADGGTVWMQWDKKPPAPPSCGND